MYFLEDFEQNLKFYYHLSFDDKKYFYPLLAYDVFLERFSYIMYRNYNKKKFSRLRRKNRKIFMDDDNHFDFNIAYLWETLLPNREQIEDIEKETIGQCCISLLKNKTNEKINGIKKHNSYIHSYLIPLDDEFKKTVLTRLRIKIIKDIYLFYYDCY